MRDVSHTPPTGDESGANDVFARGPRMMTDGGERTAGSRSTSEPCSDGGERKRSERDRMKDVSHTPPGETDDANRVFERGHEHARGDDAEGE